MLNLPDGDLAEAHTAIFKNFYTNEMKLGGEAIDFVKIKAFQVRTALRQFSGSQTLNLFIFLESKLQQEQTKCRKCNKELWLKDVDAGSDAEIERLCNKCCEQQEQDLTDLRRSVSQCPTVQYCKGWNDAIKAVQEQQNRVDKNIEEANEALRKWVEPVNPELYKAMIGEQDLESLYNKNSYIVNHNNIGTTTFMTLDGFKQAVAELQQPKFPSDEEIKAKVEELISDASNFTDICNFDGKRTLVYFDYPKTMETLTNFAKWLKGEK